MYNDEGNRLTAFTVYGYTAEEATYNYDDTKQLTVADRGGTANDESYTYDDNGNRTNQPAPTTSYSPTARTTIRTMTKETA